MEEQRRVPRPRRSEPLTRGSAAPRSPAAAARRSAAGPPGRSSAAAAPGRRPHPAAPASARSGQRMIRATPASVAWRTMRSIFRPFGKHCSRVIRRARRGASGAAAAGASSTSHSARPTRRIRIAKPRAARRPPRPARPRPSFAARARGSGSPARRGRCGFAAVPAREKKLLICPQYLS